MDTRGPSVLNPTFPATLPPSTAPPARRIRRPEPPRPIVPPAGTAPGIVRIGTSLASAIAAYLRVAALQTARRTAASGPPIEHIDTYV